MKTYDKKIEDRKVLVARLEELTGTKSRYTRVPRCAYEVGAFTVEKDGSLTVSDGADEEIITALAEDGLIGEGHEVEAKPAPVQQIPEPQPVAPVFGIEYWENEDWGEDEETAEEEETPEEEETEQDEPLELIDMVPLQEHEALTDEIPPEEPAQPEPTHEEPEEEFTKATTEETGGEVEERPAASISFPIYRHSPASIINLVCMLHTRGPLLSKATGGTFSADRELAYALLDHPAFVNTTQVLDFIHGCEDIDQKLVGIAFEDDKVSFTGFQAVDADHLQTFMKLAAAMNKMALTQKWVQAKDTDDSNEKYALRTWLIRLGMNGPEYKADRKRLMENLSGHTAFRNEEEKIRWTERQAAKREAQKAENTGVEE